MPVGRVGVEGYTRRSSTGKVVHVSRYTQKRSLADELNRLGRAPMAATSGKFAGGRTAPLSPSVDRTNAKAQQKRVAALRAQVARMRSDAAPEVQQAVPDTRRALRESVAGKRAQSQKKSAKEKALRDAEKLVNTRGADPQALKEAQAALNKAMNSQKSRQDAAAKRVEARAAAEKQRIAEEKAAAKAAEEQRKADEAARLAYFQDTVHPLAITDDSQAVYSFIHDPNPDTPGNFTTGQGPDGRYLDFFPATETPNVPDGWDSGKVYFAKPLRVAENSDKGNWKTALEDWSGGLKGEALSQKLRDEGFDGVLAYDKNANVVDGVDLTMFKPASQSQLNDQQSFSVSEYKAEGYNPLYVDLNHYLRNGTNHPESPLPRTVDGLLQHAKNLDTALSNNSLGTPKKLYRGVQSGSWLPDNLEPGTVITDKGFVSTTPDKGVADYFGDTIFEIQTPSGMPGMDISDFGDGYSANEPEVLLPRNLPLQVVSDGWDSESQARLIKVKAMLPGSTMQPLTGSERLALKGYTGRDYKPINEQLRKGYTTGMSAEDIATAVDSIDGALKKAPLPENKTLYRGVDFSALGLGFDNPKRDLPLEAGTVITDKGFLSTTADPEKSKDFGSIRLEIAVPKGYPALDVESNDLHQPVHKGEQEFLLPRNTRLEVVSDTGGLNIGRTIKLRAVPQNEGASNGNQEGSAGNGLPDAGSAGPGTTGFGNSGNTIQGQLVSDRSPAADEFWVSGPNDLAAGTGGGNSPSGSTQGPEEGVKVHAAQPFMNTPEYPTKSEQDAATAYVASGYDNLNSSLRAGKDLNAESKSIQENFDALMAKSSLNQNMTLYRGATFELGNVGDVFVDKGYISTEHTLDAARGDDPTLSITRDGKRLPIGGGLELHINVPAGYPALDMNHALGYNAGESEVVLPRGTAFKILSKERIEGTTHNGYTKAVLEVVPPGTTSTPELTSAEKERQSIRDSLSPQALRDFFDPFQTAGTLPLNSKAGKTMQAIYGGDFNGLRPVVESVEMDRADVIDYMTVTGHVYDADGNRAASFSRRFEYDGLTDTFHVHHDNLTVDKNFRGQGFATAWNRSAEDAYRQMGIDKVTLNTVSVGGYAWARAGYDWRRTDDVSLDYVREEVAGQINPILDSIEAALERRNDAGFYGKKSKFYDDTIDVLDQYRARVNEFMDRPDASWEDLPTPWDLSQIGHRPEDKNWPGKDGMIGSFWMGEKRLYDVAPNPTPPVFEPTPEMTPARVVPRQEVPRAATAPGYPDVTPERVTEAFSAPDDAFRTDMGRDIYEGKTGNFNTSVSRSVNRSYPTHDQVRWTGIISNSNGEMVGEFERSLNRAKDTNILSVKHDSLMLHDDAQGQGFASQWNAKAEKHYRDMGAAFIDVSATGVGSYAWARAGYDWSDENNNSLLPEGTSRNNSFNAIGMLATAKNYLHSPKFASDAKFSNDAEKKDFIAKTEAQIDKYTKSFSDYAFGAADFTSLPTPWEVSNVGYREGAPTWPGKVGMLHANWEGRRKLNPPAPEQQSIDRAAGIDQSVTDISNEFSPTPKTLDLPFSRDEFISSLGTTNSIENVDKANAIFGYKSPDFNAYVSRAGFSDVTGRYSVSGEILNSDGAKVGTFIREFSHDPATGDLTAHHRVLALDDIAQGQGFATAFNEQTEKAYRALGVKDIKLTASFTGGYAWARAGYDWDSAVPKDKLYYSMNDLLDRIQNSAYSMQFTSPGEMDMDFVSIVKSQLAKLRKLVNLFEAGKLDRNAADFPTPFDFSQVGYRPGYISWPGKDGLIGSTWSGEKRL